MIISIIYIIIYTYTILCSFTYRIYRSCRRSQQTKPCSFGARKSRCPWRFGGAYLPDETLAGLPLLSWMGLRALLPKIGFRDAWKTICLFRKSRVQQVGWNTHRSHSLWYFSMMFHGWCRFSWVMIDCYNLHEKRQSFQAENHWSSWWNMPPLVTHVMASLFILRSLVSNLYLKGRSHFLICKSTINGHFQ